MRDLQLPGDGVRLTATRWPGASPAVLLLHGLASQRHFWDPVARRLTGAPGGPSVVAIDQRGHGDSQRPATGYDHRTVTADVVTALDALGLDRVVVVGHSWGGSIALALAALHPERVLSVVAVDGGFATPGGGPDLSREQRRERLRPLGRALPAGRLPELLRAGPLGPWWTPEVADAVLPIFAVGEDGLARPRLPMEQHMLIVDDLLDSDPRVWMDAVTCPAWLVAAGGVGPVTDARARAREAALDDAGARLADGRVLRWGAAVHDVPLQWPDLVAGLIRTAWSEVLR